MPDHNAEGVSRIGDLSSFDASPFEHFNDVIKTFMKMTSMRRESTLEEAMKAINSSVAIEERGNNAGEVMGKATLIRDDKIINLVEIATLTIPSLVRIDNDERSLLVSQCLEILHNSFQFVEHNYHKAFALANRLAPRKQSVSALHLWKENKRRSYLPKFHYCFISTLGQMIRCPGHLHS